MARLSPREVADLRQRVCVWQKAQSLLDSVGQVPTDAYFCQPGLAFARDGWIAGELARARGIDCVRVVPEAELWPDFELRENGAVERFEAVEADKPGRRRGDEFREDAPIVRIGRLENFLDDADRVPSWLSTACANKVNKRYGGRSNLVVYLNFGDYGTRHDETIACFVPATSVAKDSFENVWVLWKNRGYHVWHAGKPTAH